MSLTLSLMLVVAVGAVGCGKGNGKGGGDGKRATGSGAQMSQGQARSGGIDCEVVARRQKECVDALVKRGGEEMVKSIRKRIAKLPEGVREKRLAAVEQTQKQLGKLMRQQLVGPDVRATCRARYGGGRALSGATARAAKQLNACLAMSDCDALARCYWKLLGTQRVGGLPGR